MISSTKLSAAKAVALHPGLAPAWTLSKAPHTRLPRAIGLVVGLAISLSLWAGIAQLAVWLIG
jgi:hypothetical protein